MHSCESATFWAKPAHTTRFLLVRHGETDWNKEKRFQGHTDIPLNTQGIEQAYLLRARLERIAHAAGVQIGQLYDLCTSSDLGRAMHTAQVLHGTHPQPIAANTQLRERHYGQLSGLTGDEMHAKSPIEFAALKAREPHALITGGESLADFYARISSQINALLDQYSGKTILLVAHGGVLDCIYRQATGEPLHTPRGWLLPNCALNVVDHSPTTGFSVALWGDVAHLLEDAGDEVDGRVA